MGKRYAFLLKNWLRFGLASAFAFSSLSSFAQNAPFKVWDKTFGGNFLDQLTFIQQTTDSGYISGGSSYSGIGGDKTQPSLGMDDYWVIKQDANGNKLWDKTYGGSAYDLMYCLQQTTDGGYILGGRSNSPMSGDKSQASKGGYDY